MVNWKKDGYKVGAEVCIVNKIGFYNPKEIFIKGKVTYVGTKRLKVLIPFGEKEKTLDFNGRRSVDGILFGDYYCVYKTEEEYKQIVADIEKAKELREYISDNLKNISLKDLEQIKEVLDKKLA